MIIPITNEGSGVYHNSIDVTTWLDSQGIGSLSWKSASIQYQALTPSLKDISEVLVVNNTVNQCINPKGVSLRWLNDKGGFEYWYFNNDPVKKELVSGMQEIEYDVMNSLDGSFITGDTQYSTVKVSSRPEIEVNSGWLTESEMKELNKINRSIRVQYQDKVSLLWQTISLRVGAFVVYDDNERQREVTIKFKLPEILIQG